jgi:photoactive yellow protein
LVAGITSEQPGKLPPQASSSEQSSLLYPRPEGKISPRIMTEPPLDSDLQNDHPGIVCAWCGRSIREGGPISHGICVPCLGDSFNFPVENLALLNRDVADHLPFGFIRLDANGIVLEYNTAESMLSGLPRQNVVGKNFFRTIAPCTCVKQFEGKIQEMIAAGKPARDQIDFLFKFPGRVTMVNLAMIYEPTRNEVVLVVRKIRQPGEKDL